MNILPLLGLWSWVILLSIPPLIVLLYFLKLKRVPLEVPSTYLWHRTIEDLHVNSIWQRLRQSLLLFLQLLLLLLVILACLRPGWRGVALTGERFIFLIDTSASMSATDGGESRLDIAKKRTLELIDQLKSGDVAMIISFSDRSKNVCSFTDNRAELRRKLKQIEPTNRTTDLREALRAADGLANPGQTSVSLEGEEEAQFNLSVEAKAATLYIFSDGGFSPVTGFVLGNLTPKYFPIGEQESIDNVGIIAFSSERNQEKPEQMQAFAELENFGSVDVTAGVSLYLNDAPRARDSDDITIPAGGTAGVKFDLVDDALQPIEEGSLRLVIDREDNLAVDNVAYAAINTPRRARVLLVTLENEALLTALTTDEASTIVKLTKIAPDGLESKEYLDAARAGAYDVIIYDGCAPKDMPQTNTLFIGARPPMKEWTCGETKDVPIVIDTNRAHPLMQFVELQKVIFLEGFTVKAPAGGTELIESNIGTLFAIAPREGEGFEDAVLGLSIVGSDEKGVLEAKTNWDRRSSFPVFVQNVLTYLGGTRGALAAPDVKPGKRVTLRPTLSGKSIAITPPNGRRTPVERSQNVFEFDDTERTGVYQVHEGESNNVSHRFSVNLFDSRESNINVAKAVPIGYEDVQGESTWQPARKELWKWLLIAGMVVLVFEWYVYNRRVYL